MEKSKSLKIYLLVADNEYVFASTGGLVEAGDHSEYRGDDIFRSTDSGKTWGEVNNGVTGFRSVSHLADDSKGRIFATMNESYASGAGGIFYSDDYGYWWHKFSNLSFETEPGERATALLRKHLCWRWTSMILST